LKEESKKISEGIQNKNIAEEKQQKQKFAILLKNSINKYGNIYGELIANGKVKIGMTKEMCKAAWGNPFNINKTTTANNVMEIWNYINRKLIFLNSKLIEIQE